MQAQCKDFFFQKNLLIEFEGGLLEYEISYIVCVKIVLRGQSC